MIEALLEAVATLLSWPTIGWMVVGVLLGIVIGATPGIGVTLGMAIILPLTFNLEATDALILLIGIYSGGMYGGAISAIILNVPGTAAAAATTLDGYPMSRKGEAAKALGISATSSALAGFLTVSLLILLTPVLVDIVLMFRTPDYFLLAFLGILLITVVSQGFLFRGIAAGLFGLLLTTIGIAPMTPEQRFTFGQFALYDGIDEVAALIALFAIAEMMYLVREGGTIAKQNTEMETSGNVLDGVKSSLNNKLGIAKGGILGFGIGAVPGAGAMISTFFAYSEAMRSSSSEQFGNGSEEGLIAAESSNNGTIAGSLIPTFTFGIPGSAAAAVLLGGLILHGLIPGPQLFSDQLTLTYTLFIALFVGNILILIVGISLITRASYLTKIDTDYIVPFIIVLSAVGTFALSFNWFDILTILLLGYLGYLMKVHDYSIIAFILGIILGGIAEENFSRSLDLSDGSWAIFVARPLSIFLVALIVVTLFSPLIKSAYGKATA